MPKRIKHYKLVRDNIPNILIKKNKAFKCKHIEGDDLKIAMAVKVLEEAKELDRAAQDLVLKIPVGDTATKVENERRKELISEIGDLLEITFALVKEFGITSKELHSIMDSKAEQRGKFKDGIYLEWVESEEE